MLMIRLSRIGKKKQPFYRLVVSEKARDMYGRALEIIGNYNPRTKEIAVNQDRLKHWMSQGAQASGTVYNLLIEKDFIKGTKVPITHISRKKQAAFKESEKKASEAKAAAEKKVAQAQAAESAEVAQPAPSEPAVKSTETVAEPKADETVTA